MFASFGFDSLVRYSRTTQPQTSCGCDDDGDDDNDGGDSDDGDHFDDGCGDDGGDDDGVCL